MKIKEISGFKTHCLREFCLDELDLNSTKTETDRNEHTAQIFKAKKIQREAIKEWLR